VSTYETDLDRNYCSCPAWKFQKGVAPADRTCKHLLAEQVRRLGGTVPGQGSYLRIPPPGKTVRLMPPRGGWRELVKSDPQMGYRRVVDGRVLPARKKIAEPEPFDTRRPKRRITLED